MHKNVYKGWKDELQTYIDKNVAIRVNGKVASGKTQSDRAKYLFLFFKELRLSGYAVDPRNLKQKHIQVECDRLIAKIDRDGKSRKPAPPATIQTYLTHLRIFCRWIGKDGMVGDASQYFADKSYYERTYAAVKDKGLRDNDIDINQILSDMYQNEPHICMILLAESAFGLRAKEGHFIRPYIHFAENSVHVIDGSKGGKVRVVPVENDYQRAVVKVLKHFVGKSSVSLMDQKLSPKQSISKYYRVLAKYGLTKSMLGRTGHGLRADFANDFMMSQGLIPIVKGGAVGALPKDQEIEIRLKASQRLGHNRVGVTTAYSGVFTEAGKNKSTNEHEN
jgi:integrase